MVFMDMHELLQVDQEWFCNLGSRFYVLSFMCGSSIKKERGLPIENEDDRRLPSLQEVEPCMSYLPCSIQRTATIFLFLGLIYGGLQVLEVIDEIEREFFDGGASVLQWWGWREGWWLKMNEEVDDDAKG